MTQQDAAYSLLYLPTVRFSLEEIAAFQRRLGNDPLPLIKRALDEFESRVHVHPLSCPVCIELAELGITRYRECNTHDGYRVIYSVEGERIFVHVLLSQRQNIQNLLLRRLLSV